jgi:hypothetical protein
MNKASFAISDDVLIFLILCVAVLSLFAIIVLPRAKSICPVDAKTRPGIVSGSTGH